MNPQDTTVTVPLTKGYVAIIDADDAERVLAFKWYAALRDGRRYAQRNVKIDGKRRTEYLHRFIVGAPDGYEVDHQDGDGLNCSRSNIRVATRSQNQMNTRTRSDNSTGFKGVSYMKDRDKFYAYIDINKKRHSIGFFDTLEDAAAARKQRDIEEYGEFSYHSR